MGFPKTTGVLVLLLSAEAVLISALINNQDVEAGRRYGLSPDHFYGYRAEYLWLQNYLSTYQCEPSRDVFAAEFPSFRFSDHYDVRSATDMVFKAHGKKCITTAMTDAMEQLGMGDVNSAYDTLVSSKPLRTNPKPRRLLTDLDFLDNWEDGSPAIETPYRSLNRVTGGMKPGQLWYLAARPGQGKSAHLVNIVTKAVLDGCKVKFYSLEMAESEVRARFHALLATKFGYKGITLNAIRDRTLDKDTYKRFVTELQDKIENSGGGLDIHTPKEGLVTPGLVANGAENYHLNVVDYIGLMRADSGMRAVEDWRNLASISNDLKLTTTAASTAFLVASQINREGDTRGDEPPRLVNLAGSDALGQDGDLVITMRTLSNVTTTFSVEKNRHGPTAKFHTKFDPNEGNFGEISPEEAQDLQITVDVAA